MTKSKITAAALAALTLAGSLVITSGSAQAHSHWGTGVGIGFAAGALIGAAAFRTPMPLPYTSRHRAGWSSVMTVGATCVSSGFAITSSSPLRSAPAPPVLAPIWTTGPAMSPSGRVTASKSYN